MHHDASCDLLAPSGVSAIAGRVGTECFTSPHCGTMLGSELALVPPPEVDIAVFSASHCLNTYESHVKTPPGVFFDAKVVHQQFQTEVRQTPYPVRISGRFSRQRADRHAFWNFPEIRGLCRPRDGPRFRQPWRIAEGPACWRSRIINRCTSHRTELAAIDASGRM